MKSKEILDKVQPFTGWAWLIACIAFFFCGIFISSVYFNNQCVEFIEEEVVPNCEDWERKILGVKPGQSEEWLDYLNKTKDK